MQEPVGKEYGGKDWFGTKVWHLYRDEDRGRDKERDDLYAFSESLIVVVGEEFVENSVCVEVAGLQH